LLGSEIYIYIYIYREREREREKQAAGQASYFGDFFAIILNPPPPPPPHTHTHTQINTRDLKEGSKISNPKFCFISCTERELS
jgi:hypothetical protein